MPDIYIVELGTWLRVKAGKVDYFIDIIFEAIRFAHLFLRPLHLAALRR